MLFFALGWLFLPLLGVQNDEALFASPLFQPKAAYLVKIGHSRLPLMLMSYLGTLKTLELTLDPVAPTLLRLEAAKR